MKRKVAGFWRNWHGRMRTLEAMVALAWARALVAAVPLRFWHRQGKPAAPAKAEVQPPAHILRHCSAALDRADMRLPGRAKCLPRALAMRTLLARRGYRSQLVIGVRPRGNRRGVDDLHAWLVACGSPIYGKREGNDRPIVQF